MSESSCLHDLQDNEDESINELIDIIKELNRDNSKVLRKIDVDRLIVDLTNFNYIIGNRSAKRKVASIIKSKIISDKFNTKTEPYMSCALLGPPGVGKTTIAKHIAKIWYSLGALRKVKHRRKIGDVFGNIGNSGKSGAGYTAVFVSFVVALIVATIVGKRAKSGAVWKSVIAYVIAYCLTYLLITISYNAVSKKLEQLEKAESKLVDVDEPSDYNPYVEYKVEDILAGYVGQTPEKFKQVLAESKGKVIFIDEAYTITNKGNLSYGEGVLDQLNKELSDDPTGSVVIIAGYWDKIKTNIFDVQKGLVRRIPHLIVCGDYSGHDLFKIFVLQAHTEGWEIDKDSYSRAIKLFEDNCSEFTNYGGDTKLIFDKSVAEFSSDWREAIKADKPLLKYKHIEGGVYSFLGDDARKRMKKENKPDQLDLSEIFEKHLYKQDMD